VMRVNIVGGFLEMLGRGEVKIFNIKNKEVFYRLIEEIKIEKKVKESKMQIK